VNVEFGPSENITDPVLLQYNIRASMKLNESGGDAEELDASESNESQSGRIILNTVRI